MTEHSETLAQTSGTDTVSASDSQGRLTRLDKLWVVSIFAAIFCIYKAPFWIDSYLGSLPYARSVLFTATGALLMGALPFAAGKRWPRLAAYRADWLPRKWSDLPWFLLLLVVFLLVGGLITYVLERFDLWIPKTGVLKSVHSPAPWLILCQALLVIVAATATQEIFWRGYALAQLEKIFSKTTALFLQAILFAAAHSYPLGESFRVFALGLLLGSWRQRRRSLLPIVVLHVAFNALALGPFYYKSYQKAGNQFLRSVPSQLKSLGIDLEPVMQEIRTNPRCKEIDHLLQKPARTAIPGIIQYLGDPNENVRLWATTVLWKCYGRKGQSYYGDALESDNPRIVEEIIAVIGFARCRELLPEVRETIMESSSLRVQISGIFTLDMLDDVEGLRQIAREHPSEKTRRAAEVHLKLMTELDGENKDIAERAPPTEQ